MTIKVTAPTEGWEGETRVGSLHLVFVGGVAEVDGPIPPGELGYMSDAGYRIEAEAPAPRPRRQRKS